MRVAALALAWSVVACAPNIAPGPIPVEQRNVLNLVAQPDDQSPNIYLQALVRAGSATDPVGQEGLAHLVARSLVDAGAGSRSSVEVRDALYVTGNRITVGVDREWVRLRLRCLLRLRERLRAEWGYEWQYVERRSSPAVNRHVFFVELRIDTGGLPVFPWSPR